MLFRSDYPPASTEKKILEKNFAQLGLTDGEFIEKLIMWAEVIRKSFADGAVDEVISTRRLVHIAKAFSIFQNRHKAIELCLNRFDADTKNAFLDFYTKIDTKAQAEAEAQSQPEVAVTGPVGAGDVSITFDNYSNVYTLTHNGKTLQISGYQYGQFLAIHEKSSEETKHQSMKEYIASNGVPV